MHPVELGKHERADWETASLALVITLAGAIEQYQEQE